MPILLPNDGSSYQIETAHSLRNGNRFVFGDLDGDGLLDPLVKVGPVNGTYRLDAYRYDGLPLWSVDLGIRPDDPRAASNIVHELVLTWDMDATAGAIARGDCRWEVIYGYQRSDGDWRLRIVEGESGRTRVERDWPRPACGAHDRHYGTIAYLDGTVPSVVVTAGLYDGGSVWAFDGQLEPRWRLDWCPPSGPRSTGGHWLSAYDIDSDGRDEIVYGGTLIAPDGSVLWSMHDITGEGHMDLAQPGDLDPAHPGAEVFFCAEVGGTTSMVSASGQLLWQDTQTDFGGHCHFAWAANVDPGHAGDELRAQGADRGATGYTADGRQITVCRALPIDDDGDGLYSCQRGDGAADLNGDGGEENWFWDRDAVRVEFGSPGSSPRRWGNRGYMLHVGTFNSGYSPYLLIPREFGPTFPPSRPDTGIPVLEPIR